MSFQVILGLKRPILIILSFFQLFSVIFVTFLRNHPVHFEKYITQVIKLQFDHLKSRRPEVYNEFKSNFDQLASTITPIIGFSNGVVKLLQKSIFTGIGAQLTEMQLHEQLRVYELFNRQRQVIMQTLVSDRCPMPSFDDFLKHIDPSNKTTEAIESHREWVANKQKFVSVESMLQSVTQRPMQFLGTLEAYGKWYHKRMEKGLVEIRGGSPAKVLEQFVLEGTVRSKISVPLPQFGHF